MSGVGAVVTLGIGEEVFAVPVGRVQEILEMRHITRLPNTPRHVLGVIDVRGNGVSVIDLRRVLRLEEVKDDDATRIIVLWIEEGERRARIAMRADQVFEVTMLDEDSVEEVPEADILRWNHDLVAGIGRRNGSFVSLLDLDRMVSAFPMPKRSSAA